MLLDRSLTDPRQAFLRLAEDLHRELATPVPPMHIESEACVALSFDMDGGHVDVLHSLADNPESILLDCEIGPVPADSSGEFESRLLRAGGELFRTLQACLSVDEQRQAVVCSLWRPLSSLEPIGLLVDAKALAGPLRAWAGAGWHVAHLLAIVEAASESRLARDGCTDQRRAFNAVVDALGAKGRGDEIRSMVEVELVHEGIRFSAVHSLAQPQRLTLELPLGRAAAGHPIGAMARWLRLNRALARGQCAAFGMAPQQDAVVFACAMELEGLSPEALQERMAEIASSRNEPMRTN